MIINGTLLQQWDEAWASHDSIKYASLFSDDFIFEDMAFGNLISGDKKKLISTFHGAVQAVPDLWFETISFSVNDSVGFAEWIWNGTFTGGWPPQIPPTNKSFAVKGVTVIVFENGRIKRMTDYYDLNTFLKAVGVK